MRRIAVKAEAHEGVGGSRPRGVLDLGGDDQSRPNGSPRACEHARKLPAVGRSPSALALLVVLSAQLMVVLDFSIVNVALPSIQRELAFSATGLEWVVTAYAITFGGLLILGAGWETFSVGGGCFSPVCSRSRRPPCWAGSRVRPGPWSRPERLRGSGRQ